MKTLANCKPTEFLVQTNRIRKHAEKWLELTGIMNIRKDVPPPVEGQSQEERRKVLEEQMKKNTSRMLDAALEEHPQETIELLGLMCFVEPENVDDHPISYYLKAFSEVASDEDVVGFFTSLIKLGQTGTSNA